MKDINAIDKLKNNDFAIIDDVFIFQCEYLKCDIIDGLKKWDMLFTNINDNNKLKAKDVIDGIKIKKPFKWLNPFELKVYTVKCDVKPIYEKTTIRFLISEVI